MLRKVLIVLAIASTAAAQTEITPYISLSGGVGFLNPNNVMTGGGVTKLTYDEAAAFEGAVGIKLDQGCEIFPVRTELAFSYQKNDINEGDGTELKTMSLMANTYLDILTGSSFSPYLMFGLGALNADLNGNDENFFAGQVGGGVGYTITGNIILDLKYKYFITNDEEEISGHQFQVGVRLQI